MIAFGGTIGAGIFVGSGQTIASIGPAVVVSYLVVGVVAVVVMRLLSALTQGDPDCGAFAVYAGQAFGHVGRFSVGWMYWWLLVVTAAVESAGAASIAHTWLPGMPSWGWSLMFVGVLTLVNLGPVRMFGEFQFWLAIIKVAVAVGVPVLAVLAVLGVLPSVHSPGLSNVVDNGGLVPFGTGSVFTGMLVAAFSFIGIEMAAIASGEADRPSRVVRKSIRVTAYTVLGVYLVATMMTVTLAPWNSKSVAASPFGTMMNAMHIPATASIINIVVFTALLSVLNSCVYAASRMGFSLARHQDAPRSWRTLSRNQVPRNAILWTGAFGFVVSFANTIAPGNVGLVLVDSSGAVGIMVWIAIALSYLKIRPRPDQRLAAAPQRTPRRLMVAALLSALALFGMLVGMVFVPSTQLQLVMTALPIIVIFIVVLWRETNASAEPDM
ncbi:MAG TPA: amino acid permease [Pseudonocardiaceae bacterium]|nr:amino acid permease [Pseudonocardiaceae bacterium]